MALHHSIHEYFVAYFQETTVCVPPADWAASGNWIEVVACDTSGIKEALMVDPTLERQWTAVGKRKRIRGIRNCEAAVTLNMHGTGTTTAEDALVVAPKLATMLQHCMGGMHKTMTRAVTGGTASAPIVSDSDTIVPGCLVAFEDTTTPLSKNVGKLHFRRVIEVDGDTDTLTLSEELPFTPASGDIAHGTITLFLAQQYLIDAFYDAGGPHTFGWYFRRSKAGTDHIWQAEGCVASWSLNNLSRGQLPQVALKIMACNFRHGDVDGLTAVVAPAAQGRPPLSMGIDVQCSIGDYTDDTLNSLDINQTAFDVGYQRVRVETNTEVIDRAEGTATYSVQPGDAKFTTTVLPYQASWYGKLDEGQELRVNFYQPGPGTGPGKAWALHIPRAQLGATPGRADVNEVHGATLELSPMLPNDCVGGEDADADMRESIYLLGMA